MPDITPFSAIRYEPRRAGGDLSDLLAPPYDVLEQADKDALLRKHERNIVAVDLPHLPPKSAGPPSAYERSAGLLRDWLVDGTLIRDPQPAFYVYHQRFSHGGRSYARRMFIARVRLQPFSEGSILPHEQTFGGPKEDRLALMKTTQCNLSPIFGLYRDPDDRIGAMFHEVTSNPPSVTGKLDGVDNAMWVVNDPGLTGDVVRFMADRKVYIADGHHRYGTALMYREWLRAQTRGGPAHDHPANFVMFVLASMDDPGCLILPYHRALPNIEMSALLEAWSSGVEVLAQSDDHGSDLLLVDGDGQRQVALRFAERGMLAALAPDECPAWRELDVAYLHRYLIDELLHKKLGQTPKVRYLKSREEALKTARDESGVALLLNPTPMDQLRAVSEAGGLMPQKSTFFYPKLATGLTINPLE